MSRKIRVYTGTGDKGDTSLFGGERVTKGSLRVEAYGTIDELSAFIGSAIASVKEEKLRAILSEIQNDLFDMGSDLATPEGSEFRSRLPKLIDESDCKKLESWIDHHDKDLPPLESFILPQGSETATRFNIARTVCRRAERILVRVHNEEEIRSENLIYLNRLSDFLFVLGRYSNFVEGVKETPWVKRQN